ncbi:MAG: glycine zipper 2TM domain-containing protein [Pigmentiphaga sp.]|uniref:glycine zipper 2TM domain-containing protein n=1 Tax=Pigmentiphaga sp. TaxID=1977564 RepID=UPI0029B7F6B4|nr:glycine zipper 2TM domain-containing protein [Pigmentiphaga sp.]MDX3906030.1 glycine zipper 2TM domain-containing protein [Pigmentiphaga sp.]
MFSGTSSRLSSSPRGRLARAFPAMKGAAALHPLVAAAAVSLIVLSAVGVGVLTGLLPSPLAKSAPDQALAEADRPSVGGRDFGKAAAYAPADKRAGDEKQVSAERSPRASSQPAPVYREPARPVAAACSNCGVVQSVRTIQAPGRGTGLGAVGGGVVGGVLGNQIGGGSGRTAFTVLGAIGGAFAGNEVEKRVRTTTQYEMTVRMDDGSVRTFHSASPYPWRSGDPVRVVNGSVVSRNAGSSAQAVRVSEYQ